MCRKGCNSREQSSQKAPSFAREVRLSEEDKMPTECNPVADHTALILAMHSQFNRGWNIPWLNESINFIIIWMFLLPCV